MLYDHGIYSNPEEGDSRGAFLNFVGEFGLSCVCLCVCVCVYANCLMYYCRLPDLDNVCNSLLP